MIWIKRKGVIGEQIRKIKTILYFERMLLAY